MNILQRTQEPCVRKYWKLALLLRPVCRIYYVHFLAVFADVFSASEMTGIVSGGGLNSTHSLIALFYRENQDVMDSRELR